jgi:primosomal protein N' (replication factor Y) (superfamily II helicase)
MNRAPHLADVAVPVGVRTSFTYLIPEQLRGRIEVGHRVPIQLGRRKTHGYVVRVHAGDAPERLRALEPPDPPEPVFDAALLELTAWVADYYLAPYGEVLEAAAPRGRLGTSRRKSRTEEIASVPEPSPDEGGAPDAAVGTDLLETAPTMSSEQQQAFAELLASMRRGVFEVHLLQGVPGSGKTEIYLALADEVIRRGGSVLLLEPEIGLATQILARVRRRFGGLAGLYHSMAGDRIRRETWERARAGDLRIIVGARSAVFVPIPNLRLVIVDEEQESAYKQEESPRYHGRDTAIVRARAANALVVLGSATPSLEAIQNARNGKFKRHVLTSRPMGGPAADVQIVDLRVDPGMPKGSSAIPLFSRLLVQKIHERLASGEQTILFLNRRGHSPAVQCSDCGEMFHCRRCDVVLTYHRATDDLRCHHCGLATPRPTTCAACGAEHLYFGGIGTQKLEERLADLFPHARLLRLDADSTRRRGSHAAHVRAVEAGKVDILLGTQMIAKGFDFPGVTLVGVLLADREMGLPELRASERAFQILTQVGGRAGRGERRGEVILQTLLPDHPVIRCAARGDVEAFATDELRHREALGYPPFARMVHLLFDGRVDETVRRRAEATAGALVVAARRAEIELLGPAPMFLTRLKGRYRWHMTLKGKSIEALHRLARRAMEAPPPTGTKGVHLHIDVDPIRTL